MCLLYILHFTKDLEVPVWLQEFWLEVIGFFHGFGFSSCLSKFQLPVFVSVSILELYLLVSFEFL